MKTISEPGLFYLGIQAILGLSVLCLSIFILMDFLFFAQRQNVVREKRSIVDTGTMALFLLLFYLILLRGWGVIAIPITWLKNCLMILGALMVVCGCILNIYGRWSLGKNWANQIKIYGDHTLVRTGMYQVIRHPLYATIILMFLGAGLVYRNSAALLAVIVIFVPFMYYRARQEETLLEQRFPQYEEYRRETGMFFPKIIKTRRGNQWLN
ncbi:MAG TPA: isoprenylcysteine carboxylmethyltransferase family protein [Syntrophomonadaceae bacterium]|nr:isoprenylcysteine carboxylmethyltransferase family protein [Syntrophomonadaceae bacterium]